MKVPTLERIEGHTPNGYVDAFTTSEFSSVEKRTNSKYNPERHCDVLYDEVAHNLRGGVKYFPLGISRMQHPASIRFSFENYQFKVIFPNPRSSAARVIICTRLKLPADVVLRAASHFNHVFVLAYRHLYETAIADYKAKNPVGVK